MAKYYCYYCRLYLTHDSMSVRKSHLMGRNHVRLYCEYYEQQARKSRLWDDPPSTLPSLEELAAGAPGLAAGRAPARLPPPPTAAAAPRPPPAVFTNR